MNRFVAQKLAKYKKDDISIALKCLSLDELTLLEVPNTNNELSNALDFIANKIISFLEFRTIFLKTGVLYDCFKDICPFKMRFNNALKKLKVEDQELLNNNIENWSDDLLIRLFNEIIPQLNYDLIVFSDHSDLFFKTYFKIYNDESIDVALSNLNNKELDILTRAFGKNLDKMLNNKEVSSEERNLIFNELMPKITRYLTYLEEPSYKINLQKAINCPKNMDIEDIALQLPLQEKDFMFRHFNKDLNSYESALDLSKKDYDFINNKLIPLLKQKDYSKNVKIEHSNFSDFFENQKISNLINPLLDLSKKDFAFLVSLYGVNLDESLKRNLTNRDEYQLNRIINNIKASVFDEQNQVLKTWNEITQDKSLNIIKLASLNLKPSYKDMVEKFGGENLLNPSIDNLKIEEIYTLYHKVFKSLKEKINLVDTKKITEEVTSEYKYLFEMVFKNYDKSLVLGAIATLKPRYIDYLTELYSINLERPLLLSSSKCFEDVINIVIPQLKSLLKNKDFKKEMEKSHFFFTMFEEDRRAILKKVSQLSKEDIVTIKKLYGENLEQELNYDALTNYEYILFRMNILTKLKETVIIDLNKEVNKTDSKKQLEKVNDNITDEKKENNKLRSNYQYFFKIFGEEEKAVREAVSKLSKKHQIILKKMYGEDLNAVQNLKEITKSEYNIFIGNIVLRIKNILKDKDVMFEGKSTKYAYFLKIFDEEEEKVRKAVLKLPEKYQNIIYKMYGNSLDQPQKRSMLSSAEYTMFVTSIISKMKAILNGESVKFDYQKNNYKYLFKIFMEDEEKVRQAVLKLPTKYQVILKKMYGEDLNGVQNLKEITRSEYSTFISNIVLKIKSILKGENVNYRQKNNYAFFFKIFDEEEEKVRKAVLKLPEKYQIILKKMYGENLLLEQNIKAISNSEYKMFITIIISKLKALLNGEEVIFGEKSYKYQYFFKIFEAEDEKVRKAVLKLPEKHQIILKKMYGEDLTLEQNRKAVSRYEYNVFLSIIPKMKAILNVENVKFECQNNSYQYFYKIFVEDEESVRKAVSQLPETDQVILKKMYGEDLTLEQNTQAISKNEYSVFSCSIIPKILKLITINNSVIDNENNLEEISFERELLNIYHNPLFIQLATLLSKQDAIIWFCYWGLEEGKRYSIAKIGEKFKLSRADILSSLRSSSQLISNSLEYINQHFNVNEIKLLKLKD